MHPRLVRAGTPDPAGPGRLQVGVKSVRSPFPKPARPLPFTSSFSPLFSNGFPPPKATVGFISLSPVSHELTQLTPPALPQWPFEAAPAGLHLPLRQGGHPRSLPARHLWPKAQAWDPIAPQVHCWQSLGTPPPAARGVGWTRTTTSSNTECPPDRSPTPPNPSAGPHV